MKPYFYLTVLLFMGCGTTPPVYVETEVPIQESQVAGTALDMKNTENIRYSEQFKAYPVGRYMDSANNMHESHTLYRAEQSPRWNLHPNVPVAVPMGPVVAVADPARQTASLAGEFDQKIKQQNQLLQATIEQNDRLGAEIQKMQTEVRNAKDAAIVNAELQKQIIDKNNDLQAIQTRLNELESREAADKEENERKAAAAKRWWKFWR